MPAWTLAGAAAGVAVRSIPGRISELEQPADPSDPAAQAYRARIRARFADLYAERTATEAKLKALHADDRGGTA